MTRGAGASRGEDWARSDPDAPTPSGSGRMYLTPFAPPTIPSCVLLANGTELGSLPTSMGLRDCG